MTISITTTSQNSVGLTVDGQTIAAADALVCLEKLLNSGLIADQGTGLALGLGGSATAVGNATDATGQIEGQVVDGGCVVTGFGTASFSAAAATDDGSTPYVSATSYAGATGADFVLTFNIAHSGISDSGSQAVETSQSTVLAVDFTNWDFAGGPIQISMSLPDSHISEASGELGSGNTAEFIAELSASGVNTLAEADFSVLTLENLLSDVSADAVIGVA